MGDLADGKIHCIYCIYGEERVVKGHSRASLEHSDFILVKSTDSRK